MVKLNNKSKRVPAKRRYKIEKRIKDHNKKVKKENKLKDTKTKRNKSIKIPNKYPFKEELLNLAEEQKKTDLAEKKQKKMEKKKKIQDSKHNEKSSTKNLDDLLRQAQKKQDQFNQTLNLLGKANPFDDFINASNSAEKETSLRTFYKEFKKVVDASDVIIQVLDARDPLGSRCPQVEEMIINSGKNKKLVLLLNKIDLVPKENVQAWLKYLRNQYPTVAFKASTQNQNEKLSQSSVPVDFANQNLLNSAKCLGADLLVKLLSNYTRINDVKQSITVGIIGLPNVGKSSVINSLKRSHACMIGSVPGLTRCMQEIKLDKHIKLLDSPGIVMSKDEDSSSLALKNCIRIESLEDPLAPVDLLLKRCNKEQLIIRYKISDFSDVNEFLTLVAKRCGKVKKTGVPDIRKAAHHILNDWITGRLTYYTQPPEMEKPTGTKIITEFSQSFDIEALLKEDEQNMFESLDDTKIIVDGVEVKSNEPTKVNFDALEEKIDADQDSDIDEEETQMDEDKVEKMVTFKSDVVLNPKVNRKIKAQMLVATGKQTSDKESLKRKEFESADIYKSEDIPRTKKMLKMEQKKKFKKDKKSEKMFNSLGNILDSVKLSAAKEGKNGKGEKEIYDFKSDFKL